MGAQTAKVTTKQKKDTNIYTNIDEHQCRIYARKSTIIETLQKWISKGTRKLSKISTKQDQTIDGQIEALRFDTEDPCGQETHLNSKILHLRITYLKKR